MIAACNGVLCIRLSTLGCDDSLVVGRGELRAACDAVILCRPCATLVDAALDLTRRGHPVAVACRAVGAAARGPKEVRPADVPSWILVDHLVSSAQPPT